MRGDNSPLENHIPPCNGNPKFSNSSSIRYYYVHWDIQPVLLYLRVKGVVLVSQSSQFSTPVQLYTSQYLGVSTDIPCCNREKMYLNVLEYELSCTGIYWKFKIVQYWKNENVLENVLECTGISCSILSGHPAMGRNSNHSKHQLLF